MGHVHFEITGLYIWAGILVIVVLMVVVVFWKHFKFAWDEKWEEIVVRRNERKRVRR